MAAAECLNFGRRREDNPAERLLSGSVSWHFAAFDGRFTLLQMLDRIDKCDLPLTQESIAQMLGAPDTRDRFQQDGLIRKRRGRIVVFDRAGLEDIACECYRAIRGRTDNVVRAPASSATAVVPFG